MAEAVFKDLVVKSGLEKAIKVDSAGVCAEYRKTFSNVIFWKMSSS